MELCTRCKKNPVAVYIMKNEPGNKTSQALCLPCAKELGLAIPPQIQQQNDQFIESLASSVKEMVDKINKGEFEPCKLVDEDNDSGAPAIDINKFIYADPDKKDEGADKSDKSDKADKEDKKDDQNDDQKPNFRPLFFGSVPPQRPQPKSSLEQYCLNLSEKAEKNQIDRIIGRDRELDRVIQILCRRQKNNPCLIGEPGVGKTAIAEALAAKIFTGDVPYKLFTKKVYLVDMTALVAGTQFRGQFESRMKSLINEVKERGDVILVIDEVHSIVGAGDAEGSMNAANILKPALSRGEIQVIGATTMGEYRKYIEKDSALERRFQTVVVEENSIDDTVKILEGIKDYYEKYHLVKIPTSLLKKTVTMSERYITDRFLPDKAIDLLDEACAFHSINSIVVDDFEACTAGIAKTKKLLANGEEELQKPNLSEEEISNIYQKIAIVKASLSKQEENLELFKKRLKKVVLKESDLAEVIEKWTGIPATSITENEYTALANLENNLKNHIVGQDAAISSVVNAIKRRRTIVGAKPRPSSFIFAGPTGVGKTELVKRLARELFNLPESLIRLDMSEFMEKHSVSRIIGAPPGYVGYEDAGQLTEKIRRKPYCVVLLDEIEKAHPDVLNIMLQILDDGRITDASGRTVNFENTIIIMTTNAGSSSESPVGFNESLTVQSEEKTNRALSSFLRPEFLNRVDEVITFRSLSLDDFHKIAKIMLDELVDSLRASSYTVSYTDNAVNTIAKKSFSTRFGARNMTRFITSNVEDKIANAIINAAPNRIELISISADDQLENITVTTN